MTAGTASARPAATRTVLVAGASGVAGRGIAEHFAAQPGWRAVALARRPPDIPGCVPLAADLRDAQALAGLLAPHEITHAVYAAHLHTRAPAAGRLPVQGARIALRAAGFLTPHLLRLGPGIRRRHYTALNRAAGLVDPEGANRTCLENLLNALASAGAPLAHVALITGGRAYGMHLGPRLYPEYQTPYREPQAPAPGPSWYHDAERLLRERAPGHWRWHVFRPSFLIARGGGGAQHIAGAIAAYAAICRSRGLPLRFPGDPGAWRARLHFTSVSELARAMAWCFEAQSPDGIFNAVDARPYAWETLWPAIATAAGLQPEMTGRPFSMHDFAARHRDAPLPRALAGVWNPRFIDEAMLMDWDAEFSTDAIAACGFTPKDCTVTEFAEAVRGFLDSIEEQDA